MSARRNIKRKIDDVDDDDDDKVSEENAYSRLSLDVDDPNEDIQIITEESTISQKVEDLNSDTEIITEDSRTSLNDDDIQIIMADIEIVFEGSYFVSNNSARTKKLPNLPMNRKESNKNNGFKIGTSKNKNKFHELSKTISNRCNENEYKPTKTCTNSRKRSLLECKNQEKYEIVIDVETDSEIHINESLRSNVNSSFRNRENTESCQNLKQPDYTDEKKALHLDVNFLEHVKTNIEFEKSLDSNKFSESSIVLFESKSNILPTTFSNNNAHNSDIFLTLKKILPTVENIYESNKNPENLKEFESNNTKCRSKLLNAEVNSTKYSEKEIQNDVEKKSNYPNDDNLLYSKARELVKILHENNESCQNLKQPDVIDAKNVLHLDANSLEHVEINVEFEKSLNNNKFAQSEIVFFEPKLNTLPNVFLNDTSPVFDISSEELKKILETVKNVYLSNKNSQNVKESVDNITKELLNADINSKKYTEKEIQNVVEKKSLYSNDYNLSYEKALELVEKRHENNESCQNVKQSGSTDAKDALYFDANSFEHVETDVEFEKSLDDKKFAESEIVLLEPKLNTLPTVFSNNTAHVFDISNEELKKILETVKNVCLSDKNSQNLKESVCNTTKQLLNADVNSKTNTEKEFQSDVEKKSNYPNAYNLSYDKALELVKKHHENNERCQNRNFGGTDAKNALHFDVTSLENIEANVELEKSVNNSKFNARDNFDDEYKYCKISADEFNTKSYEVDSLMSKSEISKDELAVNEKICLPKIEYCETFFNNNYEGHVVELSVNHKCTNKDSDDETIIYDYEESLHGNDVLSYENTSDVKEISGSVVVSINKSGTNETKEILDKEIDNGITDINKKIRCDPTEISSKKEEYISESHLVKNAVTEISNNKSCKNMNDNNLFKPQDTTKNFISEATKMSQPFYGKRIANRGYFLTKKQSVKPKNMKTPKMKPFEINTSLTATPEELHSLIKTPDVNIDLSRLYSHENKPQYKESSSVLSTNCMPTAVAPLNHTSLNNHQTSQNATNQYTDWRLQNPFGIQPVFPIADPRIPPPGYYQPPYVPAGIPRPAQYSPLFSFPESQVRNATIRRNFHSTPEIVNNITDLNCTPSTIISYPQTYASFLPSNIPSTNISYPHTSILFSQGYFPSTNTTYPQTSTLFSEDNMMDTSSSSACIESLSMSNFSSKNSNENETETLQNSDREGFTTSSLNFQDSSLSSQSLANESDAVCCKPLCLIPSHLKSLVGRTFLKNEDVLLLILEWNINWFSDFQKNRRPPPISYNLRKASSSFACFEDYYNTFLPLLLLETWYKLYDYWLFFSDTSSFSGEITSYCLMKDHVVMNINVTYNGDYENLPKVGCIVILNYGMNSSEHILEIFGYIKYVGFYAGSENSKFSTLKEDKGSASSQIMCVKIMCVYDSDNINKELPVQVKILHNISYHLKQHDAIYRLKISPLHKCIFRPTSSEGLLRLSLNPVSSENEIKDCVQDTIQHILPNPPIPAITVIETSSRCDHLKIIPLLIREIKNACHKMKLLLYVKEASIKDVVDNLRFLQDLKFVISCKCLSVSSQFHEFLFDTLVSRKAKEVLKKTRSRKLEEECILKIKKAVVRKNSVFLSLIRDIHHHDIFLQIMSENRSKLCCIIDEAHDYTESEIIVPTLLGLSKMILIGQTKKKAKVRSSTEYGFDKSCFHRACDLDN